MAPDTFAITLTIATLVFGVLMFTVVWSPKALILLGAVSMKSGRAPGLAAPCKDARFPLPSNLGATVVQTVLKYAPSATMEMPSLASMRIPGPGERTRRKPKCIEDRDERERSGIRLRSAIGFSKMSAMPLCACRFLKGPGVKRKINATMVFCSWFCGHLPFTKSQTYPVPASRSSGRILAQPATVILCSKETAHDHRSQRPDAAPPYVVDSQIAEILREEAVRQA